MFYIKCTQSIYLYYSWTSLHMNIMYFHVKNRNNDGRNNSGTRKTVICVWINGTCQNSCKYSCCKHLGNGEILKGNLKAWHGFVSWLIAFVVCTWFTSIRWMTRYSILHRRKAMAPEHHSRQLLQTVIPIEFPKKYSNMRFSKYSVLKF